MLCRQIPLQSFFIQSSTYFSQTEVNKFLPNTKANSLPAYPEEIHPERKISYYGLLDIQSYLEADIMTKVDRATMQVALEGREPFLDHHLIEFALGIPDQLKISGNSTKVLLREILFQYVPQSILERPKQGFSIPIENWLKNHLGYQLKMLPQDTHFLALFGFDKEILRSHIHSFLEGKIYINPHGVWFLFVLHQWYKRWMA